MSKKPNNMLNKSQTAMLSSKNTLLNYFVKSPANHVKKGGTGTCVNHKRCVEMKVNAEKKLPKEQGGNGDDFSTKRNIEKEDEKQAFVGSKGGLEIAVEMEVECKAEGEVKKKLRKQDGKADGPSAKRKLDNSNATEAEDDKKNGDNNNHDNDDDDGDFYARSRTSKKRRVIISDSSEEDGIDFEADEEEYFPMRSEGTDTDEYDEENSINQTTRNANSGKYSKLKKNKTPKLMNKLTNIRDDEADGEVIETANENFEHKLLGIITNSRNSVKADKNFLGKMDDHVPSTLPDKLDEPLEWPHQKLEFLQPDRLRDRYGRRSMETAYDSSSLQIPETFLRSLSPAFRQWWILKSHHFDCVLFFKVGKFYELYHMDADIAVRELGCTYMRGEYAHSGFPEVSFDKMCSTLVEKGYKVARVEQTETPEMMTERCKATKATRPDRVVRREVCQIINRGTQVYGSQCRITTAYQAKYMLSIVEFEKSPNAYCYGICFLDTSIGDCYLGEFEDDRNSSRLQTLLSHHMPVLVIHEKVTLSKQLTEVLRTTLGNVQKEEWPAIGGMRANAERTLKMLSESYYSNDGDNKSTWPKVLQNMQSENDRLGLTPHPNATQALKALGLCIALMNKFEIAIKVIPMLRYHLYIPPDIAGKCSQDTSTFKETKQPKQQYMVLDATAIGNLHILGETNSLQANLDYCCTKFGKRLLHSWLCAPSCNLNVIKGRQKAVSDLMKHPNVLQELRGLLAKLPDFERYLAQIHHFGNRAVQENHPDSRAVLFEEKTYNKTKIKNFISVLNGFENLLKLPNILRDCEAPLLRKLSQVPEEGGDFPDITKQINFFKDAFDHKSAADSGVIAPESGADGDYDSVQQKLNKINEDLKTYLAKQEKFFGCRLNYFGNDKKRFQIEVPEKYAHKADSVYKLEGSRKGSKPVRRFTTDESKVLNLLKRMQQAEEESYNILKDISRRMFEKFSQDYMVWKKCVSCVAYLDVLNAFAEYGKQQSVLCVPELKDILDGEQPFIDIIDGYHPCLFIEDYIPNGMKLGCKDLAPISVLTGPNMGGKSTLMRQVGLLVVMAQIGAHVPAKSCRLSIMDRVFTRLGAQDDMLSGQSTFFVELCDTSAILNNATSNSLVLLDELGRGTGTSDGLSIAVAVVDYLADIKCCCLFSTHYYNLIEYFHKDVRVAFGHMACMVENDDCDDPTQETVTFLYKYAAGICPKSYGFNVAKLSGIPNDITKRAYELSKTIEVVTLERKIKNNFAACVELNIEDKLTAHHITKLKDLIIYYRKCFEKK